MLAAELGRWIAILFDAMTLRSDLEHFFQSQLPAQPPPLAFRPAVSVDENLNHPELTSRLFALLEERWLVSGAWYAERMHPDGVMGHFSPLRFPQLPPIHWGERIPGTRWTDEQVIWNIVTQFAGRARVFFLSENRRRDLRGIRRILETELAPILDSDPLHRYGLMTLWKKGPTNPVRYAEAAIQIIRTTTPPSGYSKMII